MSVKEKLEGTFSHIPLPSTIIIIIGASWTFFLKSCCWSILLPQFIHSLFETSSLNSTRCVSLSLSRWGNHSECVDRTASTCSLLWTAKVKLSSSSSCGDKTMFRYLLFLSSTHTHTRTNLFFYGLLFREMKSDFGCDKNFFSLMITLTLYCYEGFNF